MSATPRDQRTGKATPELFEQVILRRLGARDEDVLVGPQHGVDVGVVRVADGVAMALTADPVFVVHGSPSTSSRPTRPRAASRSAGCPST